MRRSGRRRPAGPERVPTEVLIPEIVDYPLGPVLLRLGPGRGLLRLGPGRGLLRLGPGRGLLDYPVRQPVHAVVNVWPVDDGWAEAPWPWNPTFGWFVAPIDLRTGHVLEFRGAGRSLVGCVVGADHANLLVILSRERDRLASGGAW